MNESIKQPKFLREIRKTFEWVASSREDKESFLAGAESVFKLVSDHYHATPMLNPALVGQQRAESTKDYYEQKIAGLQVKLKEARLAREKAKEHYLSDEAAQWQQKEIEKLRRQLATAKDQLKTALGPATPTEKLPKSEKRRLSNQLDQCQHLLGKALARVKELEDAAHLPF